MIHFSEFSGIGGFDLAAEWTGWKNYLSCEINPFGNKVLEYYWPAAYHHTDIHTLDYATIDTELSKRFGPHWRNDDIVLSGGFPCQPYSTAGKRLGKEDDRHLWPQMRRTIQEIQPTYIVGENVRGLTNWNGGVVFNEVWSDLEALGYEVLPFLLPACAVDAPHRRDRIWIVAYSDSKRYRVGRHEHGGIEEGPFCQDQQVDRNGVWSQDSTRGEVVTDTDGLVGRPEKRELLRESELRPGRRQVPGVTSKRTASDSPSKRFREARPDFSRSEKWSSGTGNERFIANATDFGHEWARKTWIGRYGFENGSSRLLTETNGQQRREGRLHETERETAERHVGAFDSRNGRGAWKYFPTQPPVRSGNDGVPSGLDGITVSKWRNKSIKAAGNAIVPQVAYQIFKAIQQFHDCKL